MLACLSRRRSPVQIRSGTLWVVESARYANWQSDQVQTLVFVGSIPSCAMEVVNRVGWASVSPTACKAAALRLCRFNSCPAHLLMND